MAAPDPNSNPDLNDPPVLPPLGPQPAHVRQSTAPPLTNNQKQKLRNNMREFQKQYNSSALITAPVSNVSLWPRPPPKGGRRKRTRRAKRSRRTRRHRKH